MKRLLLLFLLCCSTVHAQALWNGFQPQNTASNPLQLRVSDGDLSSTLGTSTFLATNLLLSKSATNYIYLDLTQNPPVLVVNTTGFPTTPCYRIAVAVTNTSKITSLTDSRPSYNNHAFTGILNVTVAPTGSCTPGSIPEMVISTGVIYTCQGGTWAASVAGGTNYQTFQQNNTPLTQRAAANCIPPLVCLDDSGNSSTDITCPTMITAGASHAGGCAPDPGATLHSPAYYLGEDAVL